MGSLCKWNVFSRAEFLDGTSCHSSRSGSLKREGPCGLRRLVGSSASTPQSRMTKKLDKGRLPASNTGSRGLEQGAAIPGNQWIAEDEERVFVSASTFQEAPIQVQGDRAERPHNKTGFDLKCPFGLGWLTGHSYFIRTSPVLFGGLLIAPPSVTNARQRPA